MIPRKVIIFTKCAILCTNSGNEFLKGLLEFQTFNFMEITMNQRRLESMRFSYQTLKSTSVWTFCHILK